MTAKFNADILGRLEAASLDEINAALAAIGADVAALQAQYSGKPATDESLNAYNTLREAARKLSARKVALGELATEQVSAFTELQELTAPDSAPEPAAPAAAEPPAADPALAPAAPEPAEPTAPEGDTPSTTEEGAVTASSRRPLGGTTVPEVDTVRPLGKLTQVTTAAAGVDGYEGGQALTRRQLAEAFRSKALATSGIGVQGYQRYTVATVRSEYPEDRQLTRANGAWTNIERVEDVVKAAQKLSAADNLANKVQVRSNVNGEDALTAAGLCAPLETLYDIETVGDIDRPVRDALTRFGADRGGIQYRPSLDGVTQTGGIGVWTPTDDEDETPTPKSCVEIACPGILTAEVDAVYQCMTFSNMSTRFDPEWMDSTIEAQAIAHARFAENRLLTQLTTASKNIYSTQVLGAMRDSLVTLDKMTAYYRNVHRLRDDAPLRWIAPLWYRNMLRADIVMQMVGDGLQSLALADSELDRFLALRNINVTWHLDGINPPDVDLVTDIVTPAQFYTLLATNSAVPNFITPVSTVLFREGDWLYLDGGDLNLGVVRDSTLNGLNRFQTFAENFETSTHRGVESIHLVLQVQATGESAATKDTTP